MFFFRYYVGIMTWYLDIMEIGSRNVTNDGLVLPKGAELHRELK